MLINNYTPVTEAYFGKSKYLVEAEKQLEIIIKRLKVPFKDIGKRTIDATKINQSKENKIIEDMFCKQFGFKEMHLHWSGTDDVNAFTTHYGIMTLADGSKPVLPVKNSDGTYYDSKHMYVCAVNVYAGMIDIGLTAEEIMATILHEVGHNFVCTPLVHFVTALDWALIPVNAYMLVKNGLAIKDQVTKVRDIKAGGGVSDKNEAVAIGAEFGKVVALALYRGYKYFDLFKDGLLRVIDLQYGPPPEQLRDWFKDLDKSINDNKNRILSEWEAVVAQVKKAKEQFENNPNLLGYKLIKDNAIDLVKVIFAGSFFAFQKLIDVQAGYSNEVFADSFATAYGYGSASVSSSIKISNYVMKSRLFDKRNKYNVYNQYLYIMSMIMNQFLDEHPSDQTRMRKQIDKMRNELNAADLDPAVRKQLLTDLAKSEKIYNNYVNNFPKELHHLSVIMNYIQLNETYFGGKLDIREPINRVLNFGKSEA